MAQTEGPGPSPRDSAAQPAPDEVRRAVALPEVSGEPGEALTPTTSTPSTASASGAAAAVASNGTGDARTRSEDASTGAGSPDDAARAASEGDQRSPEDTGMSAAGAGASGGNGNGNNAGDPSNDAGRPKKPFLAAAAIAGAVLIAVPLVVLGASGGDDDSSENESVANADTLLNGRDQEEPAADYLPAESPSATPTKKPESPKSTPPPAHAPASEPATETSPAEPEQTPATKEAPRKQSQKLASKQPVPGDLLVSLDTLRCLTVDAIRDGDQVYVWDCHSSRQKKEQKWLFASDGTVRVGGKCLDIRGANTGKEALVQITGCNGNMAQQFRLNSKGEMIALISNYCLDVWHSRENGATITTNDCRDQPNQHWERV